MLGNIETIRNIHDSGGKGWTIITPPTLTGTSRGFSRKIQMISRGSLIEQMMPVFLMHNFPWLVLLRLRGDWSCQTLSWDKAQLSNISPGLASSTLHTHRSSSRFFVSVLFLYPAPVSTYLELKYWTLDICLTESPETGDTLESRSQVTHKRLDVKHFIYKVNQLNLLLKTKLYIWCLTVWFTV